MIIVNFRKILKGDVYFSWAVYLDLVVFFATAGLSEV